MSNPQSGRFETRAIHAGQPHEPVTGAVMPPIFMTSTYAQKAPGVPVGDYEYSRSGNPTRTALEANLAAIESGARGLAFASGLAASHTLMARLEPGDHVVAGTTSTGEPTASSPRFLSATASSLPLSTAATPKRSPRP